MKRLFAAVTAALVLAAGLSGCPGKEPETRCLYGDNIPPAELDALINLTDQFAWLVAEKKFKDLYDYVSSDLKRTQTVDQFVFVFDVFLKIFGSIDYPRLTEMYYMTSKGKAEQVSITCNLGQPGINDIYLMPSNREVAAAIYDATSDTEAIRLVFQLEKEKGEWRLRSLHLNPKTIKNKLGDYYFGEGLKFREKNYLHLAVLYFKTAILLHDLGANVNEWTTAAIQQQIQQIKLDYMPMGEPQEWVTPSKNTYLVYNLDAAYDRGNLLVQIHYLTEDLADHGKLEAQARDLALFLDQKFPEYHLGFDGVRVTALSQKPEEALRAYHTLFTFDELAQLAQESPTPPTGATEADKAGESKAGDTASPASKQEGKEEKGSSPVGGSTTLP